MNPLANAASTSVSSRPAETLNSQTRPSTRTSGSSAPVVVRPRPSTISEQIATSAGWPNDCSTSASVIRWPGETYGKR